MVTGAHHLLADHAAAVDKGSVDAVEILDVYVAVIDNEHAMAATDLRRQDAQIAIAPPADDRFFMVQLPGSLFGATLIHDKSYIHSRPASPRGSSSDDHELH